MIGNKALLLYCFRQGTGLTFEYYSFKNKAIFNVDRLAKSLLYRFRMARFLLRFKLPEKSPNLAHNVSFKTIIP